MEARIKRGHTHNILSACLLCSELRRKTEGEQRQEWDRGSHSTSVQRCNVKDGVMVTWGTDAVPEWQ
jgi:hypothetical protein